jgi:hypothetical protein
MCIAASYQLLHILADLHSTPTRTEEDEHTSILRIPPKNMTLVAKLIVLLVLYYMVHSVVSISSESSACAYYSSSSYTTIDKMVRNPSGFPGNA